MKSKLSISLILLALLYELPAQSTLNIGNTAVTVDTIYTGLDVPWEIIYGPDNHIWITERKGLVSRIDPLTKSKTIILDLTTSIYYYGEAGLLGMCLHPDFSTHPEVFLVYTFGPGGSSIWERLVKYTYSQGSLLNPQILIDSITGNSNHDGSRLMFMPDKTLLMTTGEADNSPLAQNLSSKNGKVLRLKSDGSVPADNPFPGSYVYTFGHRNPQGLTLAPNGSFYLSEHGPTVDDEFQLLEKSRNYGWPDVEGFCDQPSEVAFCSVNNVKEPIVNWSPTIAPSDLVYYTNNSFPEWDESFLMCTLKEKKIVSIKLNPAGTSSVSQSSYLNNLFGRLRDICVGPDKEIYLATNGAHPANIDPGTHSILVFRPPLPTVSLPENKLKHQIFTYPTVVKETLTLEVRDLLSSDYLLKISDLYGKIYKKEVFLPGQYLISLNDLEPGLYFISVQAANKDLYRTRIIIIK